MHKIIGRAGKNNSLDDNRHQFHSMQNWRSASNKRLCVKTTLFFIKQQNRLINRDHRLNRAAESQHTRIDECRA